jgi:hypothetical protein
MKKVVFSVCTIMLTGLVLGQGSSTATLPLTNQQALVNQYCAGCHNDRAKTGGFSFSGINLAHPERNAEQVEKVIRKLRTGMMPPSGRPRPDGETLQVFAGTLEREIDEIGLAHPNPGRPSLHRLNRTEYSNSIHDLLGLDINAESLLPPDDMSHGFDNMAEVLNISPSLMEGYIRAAGKISRSAIGDAKMRPIVETYPVSQSFSQDRYVEGTPFGSRGGIAVTHNFPADGEYQFIVSLVFTTNTNLFGNTAKEEKVEVAVNGERVALMDVNPRMKVDEVLKTPLIKVQAGPQRISAAFLKNQNNTDGPYEDLLRPIGRTLGDISAGSVAGLTSLPHVRDFGVSGPFNATGVSETPSRGKIFICRPASAKDEEPCAKKIITALARHAFREPVTEEHMEELMTTYGEGRSHGDFDGGIRMALELMLSHPEFVFRFERPPANAAPGTDYRVSDLELASRLSYFLWSTAPDDQLIDVAAQGKLRNPTILEQQVRRMLADPKCEALATNFAGQWLYLRNLKDALPDYYLYPLADQNLLQAMRRETELFFYSTVKEDRSILDLLTANYTFVNQDLAKHYGVSGVLGNAFRRVTLTDENRFGLLGQGSILTVTSFSNRTSPVVRGKWVLEQILGAAVPVPPPNVPPLKEVPVIGGDLVKRQTVRERIEQHRANEPCASCHKIMDPIGLSLENYDAVGSWRTQDSGYPVDTSGQLVDGTKVTNPVNLRQALLKYKEAYVRNVTGKLLMYALGRGLEYYDMPMVRAIDHDVEKNNYKFESIVMGIVKSTPFQMRRTEMVTDHIQGAK